MSVEDDERCDYVISDDSSMWSPGSYDSDCNSEKHRLNMAKMSMHEMHAYDED